MALLIDRRHNSGRWRRDVEAVHVVQFSANALSLGRRKLRHRCGARPYRAKYSGRGCRAADRLGHGAHRPVLRLVAGRLQRSSRRAALALTHGFGRPGTAPVLLTGTILRHGSLGKIRASASLHRHSDRSLTRSPASLSAFLTFARYCPPKILHHRPAVRGIRPRANP
jgi:hypothetical protein